MVEFSEYFLYKCDPEKTEKLHNLTTELRDDFLKNRHLQNLFLNRGYPIPNKERPRSFHDIQYAVWHRSVVSANLQFLELTMDLATESQIVKITYPLDELGFVAETSHGFNLAHVNCLKNQWLENLDDVDLIRKYREKLIETFDEFNLQLILSRMHYSQALSVPEFEFKKESELKERITDAMDRDSYGALDRAYHGRATEIERFEIAPLWKKLYESGYGKNFVLSPEETQDAVVAMRSGLLYF